MIITIDDYISWRKSTKCINLKYIAGDTAVLSISKNGVDAQAMYINSILTEYSIEPGCWFTVETLGYKTEIEEKTNPNQPVLQMKQTPNLEVKETKKVVIKEKEILEVKKKVETIKTDIIKPKLKPKPKIIKNKNVKSDLDVETNIKDKPKFESDKAVSKPKPKPEKDFSIASMLKDLRNEKTNMVQNEVKEEVEEVDNKSTDDTDDNIMLSISEIDMLRQQLSSCWNAPAGAVIERGDKVTISAKILQNMKVSPSSIRIVDTNIAKTNPFYGPITDSAMRTLLNPECTPLKLPKDKYNLWKNLTITFDYSIMKGY